MNNCTWETLICASGSAALPDGALALSNNLNSATLNATLEVYDCYSSTAQPASIAVTWTGNGDLIRGNYRTSCQAPGYRTMNRYTGESRYALANGSVTISGTSLPVENGFGDLNQTSNGTIYNFN